MRLWNRHQIDKEAEKKQEVVDTVVGQINAAALRLRTTMNELDGALLKISKEETST